ncbi:Flp pilus assembly protein CpaB [Aliivibrio wodanis]|uniref:Flp pilus assembly protein CpaB n=1 Tax=Aliivibrio wodanis TaxID=80852 RepID=UPI00406CC3FA
MRTKAIIAVAILAILFGLYGLAGSLKPPKVVTNAVIEIQKEKTIKVWFVKQDVRLGELLQRNALELKIIKESEANQLAITDDININFDKKAVYNRDILKGAPLFPEDIISSQDVGFVDLVISPNKVPFAIKVNHSDIVGGVINYGSHIDVLALAAGGSKLSLDNSELGSNQFKSVSVSPVLINIKVLQVQRRTLETHSTDNSLEEIHIVLELTRKQVAKMTVAKHIAEIEIHKSIGQYKLSDLTADAGDVLADYKAVKEFRANEVTIK